MIQDYYRPKQLTEAIEYLKQTKNAIPLAGGTSMHELSRRRDLILVDLQDLHLSQIESVGKWIEIGAMTTLNAMSEADSIPAGIRDAIRLEGTYNTRNLATLGGRLNAIEGRSTLVTALIALDAITIWDDVSKEVNLGEWLTIPEQKPGLILRSVKFNSEIGLDFQIVNKTELDLPILCVAVGRWKSGRTRVVVGGFGHCPKMVFDGPNGIGADLAAESACVKSGDAFATSEYRQALAKLLTSRSLIRLGGDQQ